METNQEENCMNTSTPVLPMVTGLGHGHHDRGLEGKDAVLIHANQTAFNALSLNETVSRNSKEDVIKTLDVRHDLTQEINRSRQEIMNEVKSEAVRTRDFMVQQDIARAERDRVDGKFAALEKLVSSLIK